MSSPPLMLLALALFFSSAAASFHRDFDVTWGDGRARILDNGQSLTLSLDHASGSSIQSRNEFLFGEFDVQLKLVPGNSAGTVTSFYLSSQGALHDEIDFEFLGNLSGGPYVLHANVFTRGGGGREQQFYLWFDPTADFHTYSVLWTAKSIVFSVDGTAIREFRNLEGIGVPYANKQAMRVYASIWNAEFWATRGGQVKTNWTQAPFTASYRRFHADACIWSSGKSSCSSDDDDKDDDDLDDDDDWLAKESDLMIQESIRWVQKKYIIYNYCSDAEKHPGGVPAGCVAKNSIREEDVESI
uniref:Xyloglucan endotransglucosylase/hydrolase n=1 Tax=Diospyros kaki TaxID=35925 RepID=A0A067YMW6_DIOKA|nr:xyloglucan endotransglucosylase/hydrolase 9 [Diospyros kaki]